MFILIRFSDKHSRPITQCSYMATIELEQDYYLHNFKALLKTVEQYHASLLSTDEKHWLRSFYQLSTDAQMLLIRLLSRKGVLFRFNKLNYDEITNIDLAKDALIHAHFINQEITALHQQQVISISDIFSLYTKPELLRLFPNIIEKTDKKAEILSKLESHVDSEYLLNIISEPLVMVQQQTLLAKFLLLFFGNSHQDLSQFVLSDLGLHKFENYRIDTSTQLFHTTEQVDQWLALTQLSDLYWRAHETKDYDTISSLVPLLPKAASWLPLENKRQKLINHIARDLERNYQYDIALALFRQTERTPSRERQARILMAQQQYQAAYDVVKNIQHDPKNEDEYGVSLRLEKKLAKSVNHIFTAPKTFAPKTIQLQLANPEHQRVERCAARYFESQGWTVFYLENQFLNSLFGLAMWDIIFAPIKGSFINPYQLAPLDMFNSEFYLKRKDLIDERLLAIEQGHFDGWQTHLETKQGISNYWVHWELFSKQALTLALSHIPPTQLVMMFRRLLKDLRHHRSGMPDLIMFNNTGYQWVEVKGPGDKLQDHQLRWLAFFDQHGIPAQVAYITFSTPSED
ncbi:VRR-NUC domain-containing protein [Photobacterium angustum]|uniref:VRR-NUC domain-containing protein n=1 Tax=Photobacterium angustum TaxID=661 RepID=UPI002158B751|nr:VRR-NUC domain-containing protein [Photobacterium angustum]